MVAVRRANPDGAEVWSFVPLAQSQVGFPAAETMHSANSGIIVHRVGQVVYELRDEGREFARVLQHHTNQTLHPHVTTLVYQEILGVQERLHWYIHMRAPNDYGKLLQMVDHDTEFQEIGLVDRLPDKGGGNWERMFVEGSFQETVIVPQHGLTHHCDDEVDGLFAAPAKNQTAQSPDEILNTANARAIVHRKAQVKYEFRKEGRAFAYDWQDHVNRALPGEATVLLYEEQWGKQDRIHWLIHLRSLDSYRAIVELAGKDDTYGQLFSAERVPQYKGGGTWGRMFLDGSIEDVVLLPI